MVSRIAYLKTSSPPSSRRPWSGLKLTLQRSGESFICDLAGPIANTSDIAVGNVLPPGGGANVARMAQLYSGIPYT